MKKTNFNKLKLNKKSISKLEQRKMGGAVPAETCEGPCQGGTGCCNSGPAPEPVEACYTEHGGASCGWICMLGPNFSLMCSRHF